MSDLIRIPKVAVSSVCRAFWSSFVKNAAGKFIFVTTIALGPGSVFADEPLEYPESIQVRGDLKASRQAFQSGRGTVAFMGGSITEMNGYRPMVMKAIEERFPDTEFQFVNAGISSTCSHTGAFRLATDVLAHQPDLLVVEFAVNDDQDAAHSADNALRGMEGIVRAARLQRPRMDIIMVYFVNESMLQTVQQGKVPTSIAAHAKVAEHYRVSTCNVAVELAKQIKTGKTTWKIYGGVHPKPAGNRIAAGLVDAVFEKLNYRSGELSGVTEPEQTSVPSPIDPGSFFRGRFLPHDSLHASEGWKSFEPDWSTIDGSFRSRFAGRPLTIATQVGSETTIRFRGRAFGLYVLAGPDAGTIEYSFDGRPWKQKDLYHRFSRGLHYPRTIVLDDQLDDGEHQVRLRVSESKNENSKGHAIRVLEFVAS